MKDKDQIQELFSKKLGNHESVVRPDLWNGIASQIATGTTATAGVSLASKIIVSILSTAALTTAVIFYTSKEDTPTQDKTQTSVLKKSTDFKEKDQQINNVELNQTVSENQPSLENIDNSPIVVPINKYNQEKKDNDTKVSFTETTEDDSLPIGVLKERQDEEPIIKHEKPHQTSLIAQEEETPTVFPISTDKEQLVEGYAITKMPDVFTPNNDGQNDYLFIESTGISNFSVVIMNEKSEIVFKSTDENFKWNGFDLYGKPVPDGNYLYFIMGKDRNGNPVKEYQSLTLVR